MVGYEHVWTPKVFIWRFGGNGHHVAKKNSVLYCQKCQLSFLFLSFLDLVDVFLFYLFGLFPPHFSWSLSKLPPNFQIFKKKKKKSQLHACLATSSSQHLAPHWSGLALESLPAAASRAGVNTPARTHKSMCEHHRDILTHTDTHTLTLTRSLFPSAVIKHTLPSIHKTLPLTLGLYCLALIPPSNPPPPHPLYSPPHLPL